MELSKGRWWNGNAKQARFAAKGNNAEMYTGKQTMAARREKKP